MAPPALTAFYETIPAPETIRARLAEIAREQALLRSLLRLANKKAQGGAPDVQTLPNQESPARARLAPGKSQQESKRAHTETT